jgi:hypothetical protein
VAELCAEAGYGVRFQEVLELGTDREPLCVIHVAEVYADFRRYRGEISLRLQPARPTKVCVRNAG